MKHLVLFFIIGNAIIVDISDETATPNNDVEVQSKVANLIRRILSSDVLGSDKRDSFLFQDPMRQAKVKESEKLNRKFNSPVNI